MGEAEVTLIAILSPKPGKKDRVISLMEKIVDGVTENEPGALQYEMFLQDDTQEIVFVEKYADTEAQQNHERQSYFLESLKAVKDEELLSKDYELRFLKQIAGFAHRS